MIPDELKQIPNWVCVRNGSKVPMCASDNRAASCSDPSTWCDFRTAAQAVRSRRYDGVGFVFNGCGIVGIDIDAGYDDTGMPNETAVRIINLCHSYTESSRSGRGFHILLKGELPFPGRNNRDGIEMYQTGRFFIMTGRDFGNLTIAENQTAINTILREYFPEVRESENQYGNNLYRPKWRKPDKRVCIRPEYPDIPNGCRNSSLTSLAGSLYKKGMSKEQVLKEICLCNQTACKPPLDGWELKQIVESVVRYAR